MMAQLRETLNKGKIRYRGKEGQRACQDPVTVGAIQVAHQGMLPIPPGGFLSDHAATQ